MGHEEHQASRTLFIRTKGYSISPRITQSEAREDLIHWLGYPPLQIATNMLVWNRSFILYIYIYIKMSFSR